MCTKVLKVSQTIITFFVHNFFKFVFFINTDAFFVLHCKNFWYSTTKIFHFSIHKTICRRSGLKMFKFNRKSYKYKCVVFIHSFPISILEVFTVLRKLRLLIYKFLRIPAYGFKQCLKKCKFKIIMSGFNLTRNLICLCQQFKNLNLTYLIKWEMELLLTNLYKRLHQVVLRYPRRKWCSESTAWSKQFVNWLSTQRSLLMIKAASSVQPKGLQLSKWTFLRWVHIQHWKGNNLCLLYEIVINSCYKAK